MAMPNENIESLLAIVWHNKTTCIGSLSPKNNKNIKVTYPGSAIYIHFHPIFYRLEPTQSQTSPTHPKSMHSWKKNATSKPQTRIILRN